MIKIISGIVCLTLSFIGFLDQVVQLSRWDWGTLAHHEPIVIILALAGISLLIMEFRK